MTALLGLMLLACGAAHRTAMDSAPPSELAESWKAYASRFIQKDGRVIDERAGGITTSEGQAYAMLRAVWMDDRVTFEKVYRWAVDNLNTGIRTDHLWAWKWGKAPDGRWRVLDRAFATDGDEDAAVALLLASRAWGEAQYLTDVRAVLADLWDLATLGVGGRRYLLAGESLCKGDQCRVNPSYYAPYAYRMFHEADPGRNWNELVDSTYPFLESASHLTSTGLPPDWAELDTVAGSLHLGTAKDSMFSYDALRVYWRVALDHELNHDPRASRFLEQSLRWTDAEWTRKGTLPAAISSRGRPQAAYESLEMLAAMMPALRAHYPGTAGALNQKLQSTFKNGFWADRDSYYLQNWAWFGTALYVRYLSPWHL